MFRTDFSAENYRRYVDNICSQSGDMSSSFCRYSKTAVVLLMASDCIHNGFFVFAGLFVIIGTILNLFSLYCFLRINKRHSTNVYLTVLSLVDTINLHVNFTLPLLRQSALIDNAFRNHIFICRLTGVFNEFFLIYPTWIIILLTMEPLIYLLSSKKLHSSYAQRRAKISVVVLAVIVFLLSIYRLVDLRGIDQVSAFSVVACNTTSEYLSTFMPHLNLILWSILPECLTLFLSLFIIYKIKLAKKLNERSSQTTRAKYTQATQTVLLISLLFLIFHTPTGILITLNLLFGDKIETLGMIILFMARRITVLLYEISLCCKFFIYCRTFQDFKSILRTSCYRFNLRRDSKILGRPVLINATNGGANHRKFQFVCKSHSAGPSQGSQSDSLLKSNEENSFHRSLHRPRLVQMMNPPKTQRETVSLCLNGTKTNPFSIPSSSNRISAEAKKASMERKQTF